ncbi:gamma carbonic anhydrase family protein [Acuticoccus sp. MNP-M23]|uniref:gamma carbonic anhydrase family protein n=1 Tax=Acuticoccus sp. MNP-M23 TaxID=3072793 RepID=UPI002815581A|nr:gamma carbonic anhydrase family protein [Acuticoccus sp. MNP-M23]WMS42507.1 gamma carbonic anhydrase family protein [Acuticoccus sp. MNP-M23]
MPLYSLDGVEPDIAPGAWVAPTAVLIGRVRLKAGASVWWNAVLRGDNEWIELGEGANVQDGVVCHTDMGAPLTIAPRVTVGHAAILHGCTVGEGSLIGMGATVLNHAIIGSQCLIGASALVPEGREIAPRTLAVGAPARAVRELNDAQVDAIAAGTARYIENARRYTASCREI